MKAKDLKNKTERELISELSLKRGSLKDFRFGLSGSKTRNLKEGKKIKKDIARILTFLNAKNK